MSDAHVLYVVVSKDGHIPRTGSATGRHLKVYDTLASATRACTTPGDSVVEAVVNLDREPLFIREKKVGA